MPRMSSFLTPLNPSMKVPPKRKGNAGGANCRTFTHTLNESPSEKEGKSQLVANKFVGNVQHPSMKVPPKRKGNSRRQLFASDVRRPSMKVPPKRKGNSYPKIARNHAAETGASREPRGGYTQNYTLQPHLPPPRITPWQGKKPCERHAMFPSRTRFSLTQRPPPGAS